MRALSDDELNDNAELSRVVLILILKVRNNGYLCY